MNNVQDIQVWISEVLDTTSDILLELDSEERSFLLNYSEKDLRNAIYIFSHVLTNIGTHKNVINLQNGASLGEEIYDLVKKYTNLDFKQINYNK